MFFSLCSGTNAEEIETSAWIGSESSTLFFEDSASGIELYRSSEPDCDFENYGSCENGQMDIIGSEPITDTAATTNQVGFYEFRENGTSTKAEISTTNFSGSYQSALIEFNNRLWLIGGTYTEQSVSGENEKTGNIWSSSDGVNWILESTIERLTDQVHSAQLAVHNNKLWVIGSQGDSGTDNPIWSSIDGKDWFLETESPQFSPRKWFELVSFDNKLWVFGGYSDSEALSDSWFTEDGSNWTLVNSAAEFPARYNHQATVFEGAIWITGGKNAGDLFDDIWKSTDGINWVEVQTNNSYRARHSHKTAVIDNKIWIIGGIAESTVTPGKFWHIEDIRSSMDGSNWNEAAFPQSFGQRKHPAVSVFKDKIMVVGGNEENTNLSLNDTWSFNKDLVFKHESLSGSFTGRESPEAVEFLGKLWVIGGTGLNGTRPEDIWSSEDGIQWKLEVENAPFGPREGLNTVVFNDRIWVIGGNRLSSEGDVWSSPDGVNWSMESQYAGFGESLYDQAAVHNGKIWLFTGSTKEIFGSKAWSSTDGVVWLEESMSKPFISREGFQLTSFNGKLWLSGGYSYNHADIAEDTSVLIFYDDIWSSEDGLYWTRENNNTFSKRADHQMFEHNGELWITGGLYNPTGSIYPSPLMFKNDVWSSSDGVRWRRIEVNAEFDRRANHKAISFKNKMLIINGVNVPSLVLSDIWSSEAGRDWKKAYRKTTELN